MRAAEFVDVTAVRVLERHVLELHFSTGELRVIDVAGYLGGPAFEPLRADHALFRAVRVDPELGTIVWPNGVDLSPGELYAKSQPAGPPGGGDR